MKSLRIIVLLVVLVVSGTINAQEPLQVKTKTALTIGEVLTVNSTILNEDRELNIYLPHGYSPDSAKVYPVIYLLDGSIEQDFIHVAGLVQFGSYPWIEMVPESIVVGISNVDRKKDFTYPTTNEKDQAKFPTTGGSDTFISFLEFELQPLIEATYKTDTLTTIIGQSLGGLLAAEILIKKPDLFDNYIIVSPSLWWDNESLLQVEQAAFTKTKAVYISVAREGKVMERTAKELHNKIKALKKENVKLFFDYYEGHDHGNVLHVSVYRAFEKIFFK